ncbi:hypothetical protein EG328_009649 [Venturia inaequalis]|uniref:DUF7703 domain-containing protein n=1 Tax=Venturia inaequalis TaxID=5025 RepID=A0A8H3YLU1_VENIN|nr:hypothetical protein EG328_009649 [Venturia inaequalis]
MSSSTGVKVNPSNGITGGYGGDNQLILRSMTAFTAIALYNAIEILTLIFFVFKKYTGLYFWSLTCTTFAVIPYQLGVWMKQNRIQPVEMVNVSLSTLGWVVMVPGQSLVLYSRLHLVTQNERLLKLLLYAIIFNAVVLCIPTMVLTYGSNTPAKQKYLKSYAGFEKAQMTVFTLQELFISGVYLYEIRKILKLLKEGSTRKLMGQLALINIIIMTMDVGLVSVEFCDFYQIETTLKGMIYSIKLKLEFGVLSKLVKIVTDKDGRRHVVNSGPSHQHSEEQDYKFELRSMDVESGVSQPPSIWKKSTSQLLKTGSRSEHTEFASSDENIKYRDWRIGSMEQSTSDPATLLEEIERFKKQRSASRRSSISELYPGRLSPEDGKRESLFPHGPHQSSIKGWEKI